MATQSAETTALSPLDQIMPRVYTRIILCIRTSPNADPETVRTLLSKSLRMTVEHIPFLDGEVPPDTTRPDRRNRYAIRVSQPRRLQLQSKDLTGKNPDSGWTWSYQDLADANWPVSRFDGNILSAVGVFPALGQDGDGIIMAAQANFIAGGLLLCVGVHHSVMDGVGVGTVLQLWAQNCREIQGEDNAAPAVVITPEDLNRTPLMSNGSEKLSTTGQHPEYVIAPPSPSATTPRAAAPPSLPPMEAKILYFSADSLARLKDAVKSDAPAELASAKDLPSSWISTNDALSALLWNSITRARLGVKEGEDLTTVNRKQSKLGMANNGRRKLDSPLRNSYLGNVNLYSLAVLPTATVASEELLGQVARSVCESVNRIDDLHIRSAVKFVDELPDVARLVPAFNSFLGPDLAISSWAKLGLNGLDWGQAIGTVERVRVPDAKFDGLCIVLPATLDRGLEVYLGLKVETMEKLLKDEFFMSFAQVGQ